MMSDALRIGQAQQGIEQKKLTDVVDTLYKGALIQDIENRGEVSMINAQTELAKQMRKSPWSLPGLGELDFETWKSLDTKTKAYSYYAFDAKSRGEEVMPYNEWSRQTDKPTLFEYYELAKEDPEFKQFLENYNESKATKISIGEKAETREALGKVDAKLFFTDPEKLIPNVNKHLASPEVRDKLLMSGAYDSPESLKRAKTGEIEKYIDKQLETTLGDKGKILEKRLDGTTFVWKVQWPDGSISEVKYAN